MYKIKLQSMDVTIGLDTVDPNESVEAIYNGRSQEIDFIKSQIDDAFGAFGHRVNSQFINPIDLSKIVFADLADLSPEVIEGEEIVGAYDPNIPDEAVT